jgi:hypothetical protein
MEEPGRSLSCVTKKTTKEYKRQAFQSRAGNQRICGEKCLPRGREIYKAKKRLRSS